jgi:hypothetical protein
MVTVRDVFAAAALSPHGPVPWGTPVPERRPGVYVIALTESPDEEGPAFDHSTAARESPEMFNYWVVGEPIVSTLDERDDRYGDGCLSSTVINTGTADHIVEVKKSSA